MISGTEIFSTLDLVKGTPLWSPRTSGLLCHVCSYSCCNMAMEKVPPAVTLFLWLLASVTFGTAQDTKHCETKKGWVQHAFLRQVLRPVEVCALGLLCEAGWGLLLVAASLPAGM